MEIVDLTQPLHSGIPIAPILPPFEIHQALSLKQDGVNVLRCCFPTHAGTHLDAPSHFVHQGRTVDQIPLDWLMGPATLIDIPRQGGEAITIHDLKKSASGIEHQKFLLLRTGFGALYEDPRYFDHPYLSEDAASWIRDRGVRILGLDTITPEMPHYLRRDKFTWPIHHLLLEADVLITENLNLQHLRSRNAEVQVLPLPIRGGDGAPARAVAYAQRSGEQQRDFLPGFVG